MGYFQVRYNSRVVIYDRRGFIRLATGIEHCHRSETKSRLNIFLILSNLSRVSNKKENF